MALTAPPPLIKRVHSGHWVRLDQLAACGYALMVLPMLMKYASGPAAALAVLGGLGSFAGPLAVRRRWLPAALGLLVAGVTVTLLVEPRAYIAVIIPMACVLYLAATGPRRIAFVALGVSLASAAAAALPTFAHLVRRWCPGSGI